MILLFVAWICAFLALMVLMWMIASALVASLGFNRLGLLFSCFCNAFTFAVSCCYAMVPR